jgi:hypothetical protein
METTLNPQMFALAGSALLLVIALVARYVGHRKHPRVTRSRYGEDHSEAIAEMGKRSRAEAQRKERERLVDTSPSLSR